MDCRMIATGDVVFEDNLPVRNHLGFLKLFKLGIPCLTF